MEAFRILKESLSKPGKTLLEQMREMDLCVNFITVAVLKYVSGGSTEQDKAEVQRQKHRRIRSNDTLSIKIDALHSYQFADTNSGIIFSMENGDLFFTCDYKLQKQAIIFSVIFGCKYY